MNQDLLNDFIGSLKGCLVWDIPAGLRAKIDMKILQLEKAEAELKKAK